MPKLIHQVLIERGSYEDSSFSCILLHSQEALPPVELYRRVSGILVRALMEEIQHIEQQRKDFITLSNQEGRPLCENCCSTSMPQWLTVPSPDKFLDDLWKGNWQDDLVNHRMWELMEPLGVYQGLHDDVQGYLRMSRIDELWEYALDNESLVGTEEDEYWDYHCEVVGCEKD